VRYLQNDTVALIAMPDDMQAIDAL